MLSNDVEADACARLGEVKCKAFGLRMTRCTCAQGMTSMHVVLDCDNMLIGR